jgi:hypothetical protein
MQQAPQVFDRKLYLSRQSKARGEALNLLDQHIAAELTERLSVITRQFDVALVIAPQTDLLHEAMSTSPQIASFKFQPPSSTDDLYLQPQSLNAIISLLDLHAINDVPGYMAQVANALKPDGLALFCFFAGETLRELRESWLVAEQELSGGASPRVAPMIDLREAGGLLQRAGLALPVADTDRVTLRYADAFSLMREIKSSGFSNCLTGRQKKFSSRRLLLKAADIYQQNFSQNDGRIPATVETAWTMAWKPHSSQQQPLKPGSAKARLANALSASEAT